MKQTLNEWLLEHILEEKYIYIFVGTFCVMQGYRGQIHKVAGAGLLDTTIIDLDEVDGCYCIGLDEKEI